jgi:hypothetical protein
MPNVKSDLFNNMVAQPRILNPALVARGAVYFARATNLVAIADVLGTIYPVMRLPAHARIISVIVANDILGAGFSDADLGLYPATDWSDVATVATPFTLARGKYADGVTMVTARNILVDPAQASIAAANTNSMGNVLGSVVGAAEVITGLQWARRLWEDAGFAIEPRPGTEFDLCWTVQTEPAAAGSIVTGITYVMGA